MAASPMAHTTVAVWASWDMHPSPKPSPFKSAKSLRLQPSTSTTTITPPPPPAAPLPSRVSILDKDFSLLLNASRRSTTKRGKSNELYMGYETWLPVARKVNMPHSIYIAATLAYLGDCIYEDLLLKKLLVDDYLTEEERKKTATSEPVQSE